MKYRVFFQIMDKVSLVKVVILTLVWLLVSCSDQQEEVVPQPAPVPDDRMDDLVMALADRLQISESRIVYDASCELFIADGDMVISKQDLEADLSSSTGYSAGRTQQRQFLTIVSQEIISSVKVRIPDDIPFSWASAIRQAMDHWNAVTGTKLNFIEVASGEHILIRMGQGKTPSVIASASIPVSSKPGRYITIDPDHNDLPLIKKINTAAHELGHTMGLGHTNELLQKLVPTTPVSDEKSVMYSFNQEFNGFTEGDIRAIQVLYPYPREELYIVHQNTLYAVDDTTGRWEALGLPNWYGDVVMTSSGGHLFAIQDMSLWRTDPDEYNASMTKLSSGWYSPSAMTSLDGNIYTVQGGHLWKTDADGNSTSVAQGWQGTEALTASGEYLFAAIGGYLLRVDTDGTFTAIGNGWFGVEAMTAIDGYVYFVHKGELWKDDGTGKLTSIGKGWNGTQAMTHYNGFIYAVQGGKLWRVDPIDGSYVSLGGGWGNVKAMTALTE